MQCSRRLKTSLRAENPFSQKKLSVLLYTKMSAFGRDKQHAQHPTQKKEGSVARPTCSGLVAPQTAATARGPHMTVPFTPRAPKLLNRAQSSICTRRAKIKNSLLKRRENEQTRQEKKTLCEKNEADELSSCSAAAAAASSLLTL
jgi:hypothetical protein